MRRILGIRTTDGIHIPIFGSKIKIQLIYFSRSVADKVSQTSGLWPVCVTIYEANVIALIKRYGLGYFENQTDEEALLSLGWRFMGFDVVDLDGLISGLKGCGYVEPAWSQLRNYFANSLNEVGLFNDLSVASQFAEVRGLQIRDHAPFVVAGVLTHDPIA